MPKKTVTNIARRGRDWALRALIHQHREINNRLDVIAEQQSKQAEIQTKQLIDISTQLQNKGLIQLGDHEILVKIFNGLKIYLDTRDIGVVPHMALDGIWEPEITKAWLSLVQPHDTVFDIGANFGYFGLLAAYKTSKKHAKVVFIEANPHLTPYIKKTLSLNWYNEQSVVENFAVSDKKGKVKLNILKDFIASSSVQTVKELDAYMHDKMEVTLDESVEVEAVAIDDYCEENNISEINLLKMDIEGYEDKAYAGMRKIIKASPRVSMFVEFTRDGYENPKAFYEQMLTDFGHVYLIGADGSLSKPADASYEAIIGEAEDWVMPVFSKISNLA